MPPGIGYGNQYVPLSPYVPLSSDIAASGSSWLGRRLAPVRGALSFAAKAAGPAILAGAASGLNRRLGAFEGEIASADDAWLNTQRMLQKNIARSQGLQVVPVVNPDGSIGTRPATDEDRRMAYESAVNEFNEWTRKGPPSARIGNPLQGRYFREGYQEAWRPDPATGKPGGLLGVVSATAGQIKDELPYLLTGERTLGRVSDVGPDGTAARNDILRGTAPPAPMSAIPPEPEAVQAEAPVAALPVAPSKEVMRESARGVLADPNATPDQRMRAWAALGISGEAVESVEQARRDPAYAALLRRGTELERERNRLMRDVGAGGEQWRFGPQPWQVTTQIGGPRAPTAEPAMGSVFRAAPYGTAGNDAMAYRSMLGRGMTREQAQRNVQAKRRETAAARNLADVRRERELARQERRETRQEAFDIEREKIDVQREQGRIAVLMRQQAAERAMEESQRKLREYAAQLATKAQIDEAVELGKRDRNVEGARSVLTAKQQSAINMLTSKDPEKRRKLFAMYAQFVQEGMKNGLPATKINENFYQQVVRNAKAYGI